MHVRHAAASVLFWSPKNSPSENRSIVNQALQNYMTSALAIRTHDSLQHPISPHTVSQRVASEGLWVHCPMCKLPNNLLRRQCPSSHCTGVYSLAESCWGPPMTIQVFRSFPTKHVRSARTSTQTQCQSVGSRGSVTAAVGDLAQTWDQQCAWTANSVVHFVWYWSDIVMESQDLSPCVGSFHLHCSIWVLSSFGV